MHSKMLMYEVFCCGEATFQGARKYYTFCFDQTNSLIRAFIASLIYILCFSIHSSLHHKFTYTVLKFIVYQYCSLFSKLYQNRYQVIGQGVSGPGIAALRSRVLRPGYWDLIWYYASDILKKIKIQTNILSEGSI